MPSIWNESFGGGVGIGTSLADKIQQRRDRSQLQELADLARGGLGNAETANALGAGLIGLGQVGAGIRAQNVPYQREQQRLQQEFQNTNAMWNRQIAQGRLDELRRVNDAKLDPNNPDNAETFGKTPVYYHDPETDELRLGLVGDQGSFRPLEDIKPAENLRTIDTGFGTRVIGGKSGVQRGDDVSKNVASVAQTKADSAATGKATAEKRTALIAARAKLPGLQTVVGQLSELGQKATYRLAGQIFDYAGNKLGAEPTEGAKARTQYIAMVNNQVLPLLRETFGAAFTVQEGQDLRNTLGAADKSPQEKDAVLRAFIEQKIRNIEDLERELQPDTGGFTISNDPSVTSASGDASGPVKWRIKSR